MPFFPSITFLRAQIIFVNGHFLCFKSFSSFWFFVFTMNKKNLFFVNLFQIFALVFSAPQYESIFNFGDSLSDTGNFLLSGALAYPIIGHLPYGETFFQHATGRCSDGRLIIDFIGTLILFLL